MHNVDEIKSNYKDISESQLIFDLVNGRQTPIGVVQTISQHVPSLEPLGKLQSLIISLAVELPFAQATLVPLLEAYYHCSNKELHHGIWSTFGMNEGDLHSSLMYDNTSVAEYININGFEAQLWQTMGADVKDLIYGNMIGELAKSVEMTDAKDTFHSLDVEIAAGCHWVIHGGKRAWQLSKMDYRDQNAKDRRGELCTGQPGYSVERWKYWKSRFGLVADGKVEGIGAETRRLAVAVVSNMEAVETLDP